MSWFLEIASESKVSSNGENELLLLLPHHSAESAPRYSVLPLHFTIPSEGWVWISPSLEVHHEGYVCRRMTLIHRLRVHSIAFGVPQCRYIDYDVCAHRSTVLSEGVSRWICYPTCPSSLSTVVYCRHPPTAPCGAYWYNPSPSMAIPAPKRHSWRHSCAKSAYWILRRDWVARCSPRLLSWVRIHAMVEDHRILQGVWVALR
ncbi:hypothetical protein C8F01DRAFT_625754 [Mycena amicta]|nr:hypothetical protein C8F01DRAFT_625754 [Mycena amicta]